MSTERSATEMHDILLYPERDVPGCEDMIVFHSLQWDVVSEDYRGNEQQALDMLMRLIESYRAEFANPNTAPPNQAPKVFFDAFHDAEQRDLMLAELQDRLPEHAQYIRSIRACTFHVCASESDD